MTTATTPAPGRRARTPREVPPRGWWQVVRRAVAESSADNVPMLAGGVAYFAFLAIFPALIAAVTLYGLVADPATVTRQVGELATALPQGSRPLITDQLSSIASGGGGALGVGLVVSVLAALWSASSGVGNLMQAVNLAYDEREERGFVALRGTALLLTVGAVVFVLLTLALVAVVPTVLDTLPLGPVGVVAAQVVRWLVLLAVVVAALAVVYRVAPDRDAPRFDWVSPGAVVAAVLWLAGSVLFSVYVDNFGSYNETYGALAGVVVLLLWLYLTAYIVLLGAEINAESERQTVRDTTVGDPRPRGSRGARAADEVADDPPEGATDGGRKGGLRGGSEGTHGGASPAGGAGSVERTGMTGRDPARSSSSGEPTVGELMTRLSEQTSHLVRDELALAQIELRETAKQAGKGAGLLGAAAVLAWFGLGAALATAIIALALVLPLWASALVVTAVVFVAAGVAALLGRNAARNVSPTPARTVENVRRDVEEVQEARHRDHTR